MVPKLFPVRHLVYLRNANPVLVRRDMLCHYVHGYLAEIQVCADTCCCRNARILKHITDNGSCKLVSRHLVCAEIGRYIHKHLVDRIYVNILWSNIFQVYLIYASAVFYVEGHSWNRSYEIYFPVLMLLKLLVVG